MKKSDVPGGSIQSVERALNILRLFKGSEELGITQISTALDLPKGTVHGLVKTLEKCGYLEQNLQTQKYSHGIEVFKMGYLYSSRSALRRLATEKARELSKEINELTYVAVLIGFTCVIFIRCDPPVPILLGYQNGSTIPVHCTALGKVLLSGLSEARLEELIRQTELKRFTEHTITDVRILKEKLEEIREKGYGINRQEAIPGLSCIAAPVRNYAGEVISSISTTCTAESLKDEARLSYLVSKVVKAAEDISVSLGYDGKIKPG